MDGEEKDGAFVVTNLTDLSAFVVQYERRHAELEQKVALQAKEQEIRDSIIRAELTVLHNGIDEIKAILNNGLVVKVADLIKERDEKKQKWNELLIPTLRDWIRIILIIGVIEALQNAHSFISVLGGKP